MRALADPFLDDRDRLREILAAARTIAIVGASTETWRPSHGIAGYLKRAGYRIYPVNPTARGERIHGETCLGSLAEVPERVDLVNVFRRPEYVPAIVEDAIAIGAPAIWLQLGVRNQAAAERAEAAGMKVVMDRCISVEHSRLMRG